MVKLPKGVHEEPGRGRRPCPFDPRHFLASRAKECQLCRKTLPIKERPEIDPVKSMPIISDMGGLQKVKELIETVEESLAALKRLGGVDKAKATVAVIEKLRSL